MTGLAASKCRPTRLASSDVSAVGIGRGLPRWIEMVLAALILIAAAPLLLVAGAVVAMTSPGPVVFRQWRIGRHARKFRIYKLRTMAVRREQGTTVTAADDPRVTSVGRVLRKAKLDELPELWNVLKGDMSFVGPRPEVPEYVDLHNPNWLLVLQVRPGLTDPVTLRLRNEETLLAFIREDRESFYLRHLQPFKLTGYIAYLEERSWWTDVKVLAATCRAIASAHRCPPPPVEEIIAVSAKNVV